MKVILYFRMNIISWFLAFSLVVSTQSLFNLALCQNIVRYGVDLKNKNTDFRKLPTPQSSTKHVLLSVPAISYLKHYLSSAKVKLFEEYPELLERTSLGDLNLINLNSLIPISYNKITSSYLEHLYNSPDSPAANLFEHAATLYDDRARYFLTSKPDFDSVNNAFMQVVEKYPNSQYADDALLFIARQYRYYSTHGTLVASYDSVIDAYKKVINWAGDHQLSEFTDEVYDMDIPWLRPLNPSSSIRLTTMGFHQTDEVARFELGWFYTMVNLDSSLSVLKSLLNDYTNASFSSALQFTIATISEKESDFRKVIDLYNDDTYIPACYQYNGSDNLTADASKRASYRSEIASRYSAEDYFDEGREYGVFQPLHMSFSFRWNVPVIKMKFVPDGSGPMPSTHLISLAESAINAWNSVLKKYGVSIAVLDSSSTEQPMCYTWFSGAHSGEAGTAWVAFAANGNDGESIYWSSVGIDSTRSDTAMFYTLVHEYGHMLGLLHSFDDRDIMAFSTSYQPHDTIFTNRDLETINRLYSLPVFQRGFESPILIYEKEEKPISLQINIDTSIITDVDSVFADLSQINGPIRYPLTKMSSYSYRTTYLYTGSGAIYTDIVYRPTITYIAKNHSGDEAFYADPLALAVQTNQVVPVELVSFSAKLNGENIILNWNTATEINNKGFEIQRKLNSGWEKIGYINGNGTTSNPQEYSFEDNYEYETYKGNVNYRLKQIDFNGSFNYSKEIKLNVDFTPKEFILYQNYPNPFNPRTTIKYSVPNESFITIKVYDFLGKEIKTLVNEEKQIGNYKVLFDANKLSSGIYFYRMQAGNFVETKKLILLK